MTSGKLEQGFQSTLLDLPTELLEAALKAAKDELEARKAARKEKDSG